MDVAADEIVAVASTVVDKSTIAAPPPELETIAIFTHDCDRMPMP